MSESLGEALPKEQARVRALILQYRDPIMNGAGELSAMMMERSLKAADLAAAQERGRREVREIIDDLIQVAFDGPREAKGAGCPETVYEWRRRIEKKARAALLGAKEAGDEL